MTIEEVRRRYRIPAEILKEYESWDSGKTAGQETEERQYDDSDLEKLSLIMTLHDIGFAADEIEAYMKLTAEGGSGGGERLRMLDQKRTATLDEIHFYERKLERLDYLRHEIRRQEERRTRL